MLIHPCDAASSDTEWRNWLAGHDFGQLAVSDPGNGAPRHPHSLRRRRVGRVLTSAYLVSESCCVPGQGRGRWSAAGDLRG